MDNTQLVKELENIRKQLSRGQLDTELKRTFLLFCQLVSDEVKLPEVGNALFEVLNNE